MIPSQESSRSASLVTRIDNRLTVASATVTWHTHLGDRGQRESTGDLVLPRAATLSLRQRSRDLATIDSQCLVNPAHQLTP